MILKFAMSRLASLNLPSVPGIRNDSGIPFSIHLKDEVSIPYI